VPFLHGVRGTVIRDKARTVLYQNPEMTDFREETLDESEKKQRHKEPRLKEATTSQEGQDIRQDLQEDRRTGGRKSNSRNFH
jgi:hypothetical protein